MLETIGLHFINSFSGQLDNRVPIVKCMDASDETIAETIVRVGQNVPVIVRWYESNQNLDDPAGSANAWFDKRKAQMAKLSKLSPRIAFEGFNEAPADAIDQYIIHETRRLELMHREGFAGVYINSSRGCYEPDEWRKWRASGFFDKLWPTDRTGIHEYGSGHFEQDYPHLIGRAWDFGDIGQTLKDVPLVVSEFGALASNADLGWKVCLNGNWDAYKAFIQRCDEYYRSKNVLACLYTGGNCAWGWTTHCVNDVWERINTMYTTVVQPPEPPPTQPSGVPVPDIFYLLLGPRAAECHTSGTSDDHLADGKHVAYDVAGMKHWPVYAVADGWVDFVTYESATSARGRGHCLGVVHPGVRVGPYDCLETSPCHLSEKPLVKYGDKVRKGQLLGYTGWTGKVEPPNEYGEHVHLVCYSVKDNAAAYPYVYIRPESLRVEIVQ